MGKKRNRTAEPVGGLSLMGILLGGAAGLLLTVILIFAASWAMSREQLPMSSCSWLGPAIIGISAFFSAWIAACQPCKKMLHGLLAALLYGLILLICGMLLFSAPMQVGRLLISAAALAIGGIGGVLLSGLRG